MKKDYWIGRWERGETGWHQQEVEPALVHEFSTRVAPCRVFVPLCGKSLDLKWLIENGYEVVGVELSALACDQFFFENKIPFKIKLEGDFRVYQGEGVTLFNGDFFKLNSKILGRLGAVYDRAALIAMPLDLRSEYAKHLVSLVTLAERTESFSILQLIIERVPAGPKGPPFSVTEDQLRELYHENFEITQLSRERVEGPVAPDLQEAPEYMIESVFRMECSHFKRLWDFRDFG